MKPKVPNSLEYVYSNDLKPNPRNPRKHDRAQLDAIARSIEAFGFNAPILVDGNNMVVAGHGRLEAAKILGLEEVPVIRLEHLTAVQAQAYMLADNKLTDRSSWDDMSLACHLKELSEMALDFDVHAIGFELPEIDLRIEAMESSHREDPADEFSMDGLRRRSKPGSLWSLGDHRLYCGNALDSANHQTLMNGAIAVAVFTDPPYNVKIDGHVSGKGKIKHREFAMASGEMDVAGFTSFLSDALKQCTATTLPGGIMYVCMDFRHMLELITASGLNGLDLLNLCVWVKTNGGMGSFYRSRHELVFVLRNGPTSHQNNVQLGRFGRNRSNVWNYAGANIRVPKGAERLLEFHPTAKPIALVADAIRDCTSRGDIVLDPFAGSGTTILAAERTGRYAYCMELDPVYVDLTIARWEQMTARSARLAKTL